MIYCDYLSIRGSYRPQNFVDVTIISYHKCICGHRPAECHHVFPFSVTNCHIQSSTVIPLSVSPSSLQPSQLFPNLHKLGTAFIRRRKVALFDNHKSKASSFFHGLYITQSSPLSKILAFCNFPTSHIS